MAIILAGVALLMAAATLIAIFQWAAQNAENARLRMFRDRVEQMFISHDYPERTLTQNDIATILKELDQCLKP